MTTSELEVPATMRAMTIERFGGLEEMDLQELPVPTIGPDDVLLHVETAGVGAWDPLEREGGLVALMPSPPSFPYVLGSDGAGTVAAVGERVSRFAVGDRVYAFGFLNPKGGFYAEYAAVRADDVSALPANLPMEQAGAMPVDAMTALRGLEDVLGVQRGETLLVFGASGGIGHLALQLGQRLGARVLAVASGEDGVELCERLGADVVVDGKTGDVAPACREFAAEGIDAALVTTSGRGLDDALSAIREGGRVAYPNGVQPEPEVPRGVRARAYDGTPDRRAIEELQRLIEAGPFEVHVGFAFPLALAADAHRALDEHHLGKLALRTAL